MKACSFSRIIVFCVVACSLLFKVIGAEISVEQAKSLAVDWIARRNVFQVAANRGRTSVNNIRTIKNRKNKPLFHVVKLEGGGFVVVAGDDVMTPVIAFSEGDDLEESDQNPLWIMLNRDIPMRLSFSAMLESARNSTILGGMSNNVSSSSVDISAKTGASLVDDMRVRPILGSKWDQTMVGDKAVYNYWTPSGMPCGCVATAAAQIMRYHEFPREEVAQEAYQCEISKRDATLTTIGGTYDWSLMPLVPNDDISASECEMIGRLVYDVGVASRMSYGYSGSGTISYYTQKALKDLFHYKQAVFAEQYNTKTGVMGILENAMLANFDAGHPVMMGISGKDVASRQNIGHEIVGDGYGYIDGTLYVHLNLGWSGEWDAWYNLPNIDAYSGRNGSDFNLFDDIVYNIFPSDELEIVSGRICGADGAPIQGANVRAFNATGETIATTTSSEFGVYALKIPAEQEVSVSADVDGFDGQSLTVTTGRSKTYSTYFDDYGDRSLSDSVGNRWGNDIVIDAGMCPAPVFSRASCSFVDQIAIKCNHVDEKAKIRYTTDGTEPGAESPEWPANGLTIRATTTLKARAFRGGMTDSAVVTAIYTDHPQPKISGTTIAWERPVGAEYFKIFKASNRYGTDVEECCQWFTGTSFEVERPVAESDVVFYFVSASSRPDDDYASPLSDALECTSPEDRESGAATQVLTYFETSGGTNLLFKVSDFPATVKAVYYSTHGAFGENGSFTVNFPTTSKKNISLPENIEEGAIKTTKIFFGTKFGEANGSLFMSGNSSRKEPREWRTALWFEQAEETNYVSSSIISHSPVYFHCFQQCAAFVELSKTAISIRGIATNGVFNVTCPREHEWTAKSDSPWLSISRSRGRGSCPVRFVVESNPYAQLRKATITVTCGTDTKTVVITQGEHEEEPEPVVPGIIQAVATQGTKTSSVFLHWTAVERAVCYEIYRSSAIDEFPSEPYWTSSNSIPALIDFGAVAGMVYYYQIVAVTEEGCTAPSAAAMGWTATKVNTSHEDVSFDATGGVVRVVVSSNAGWSAETDADWLKLEAIDTERNGVLDIMADENLETEDRTAKVILIGGGNTAMPSTNVVVITQSAVAAEDSVGETRYGLDDFAGKAKSAAAEYDEASDPTAHAVLEFKGGDVVVTWESRLPEGEQARHVYTLWGKSALESGAQWQKLDGMDDRTRATMHFFKVSSSLKH